MVVGLLRIVTLSLSKSTKGFDKLSLTPFSNASAHEPAHYHLNCKGRAGN